MGKLATIGSCVWTSKATGKRTVGMHLSLCNKQRNSVEGCSNCHMAWLQLQSCQGLFTITASVLLHNLCGVGVHVPQQCAHSSLSAMCSHSVYIVHVYVH